MKERIVLVVLAAVALALAFMPTPTSTFAYSGVKFQAYFGDCDPRGTRVMMKTMATRVNGGWLYSYEFAHSFSSPQSLRIKFTSREWEMIEGDSQFEGRVKYFNQWNDSSGMVTVTFQIEPSSRPFVISAFHTRRPLETAKTVTVIEANRVTSAGQMMFWSPDFRRNQS